MHSASTLEINLYHTTNIYFYISYCMAYMYQNKTFVFY